MKTLMIAMFILVLPASQSFAFEKPCKEIVKACEAAGFLPGGHKEKKGLWKDCVQPLKAGRPVAGVSVDPGILQACSERKEKKAEKLSRGETKKQVEPQQKEVAEKSAN